MLIGLALAGLVLLSISLQRAYTQVSVKELKRRARQDDHLAAVLHKAAVYGVSLRALLWFLVAANSAGFFIFAADHLDSWSAFVLSLFLVLVAFVWLPNRQASRIGMWFAGKLAPAFGWILQYLHSPITAVHQWLQRFASGHKPTGIYDKEDLLHLINHQNEQPDNQIPQAELELVFNALTFGDKLVSDHLTTRRHVKAVSIDDSIGPIMMTELHASGQSRFPVYEGKKDNIVGTLFLKDLVNTKSSAKVSSVMRHTVCYVHEDQTLQDALQAILRTHHHLLIVVNSREEYVGAISIEDILEQIVGKAIINEFDQYEDLGAVARRAAHKDSPSEEPTEVVE